MAHPGFYFCEGTPVHIVTIQLQLRRKLFLGQPPLLTEFT